MNVMDRDGNILPHGVQDEIERLKKRIEELERRPVYVPYPVYPVPAPVWPPPDVTKPWLGEPFTYGPTFTCHQPVTPFNYSDTR